jgi:NAD(P)-dependent dehydrogenase (short-subunit alcohol dehydrogenase family)
VSGDTSGIGAAIAALLARLGPRVTVTGASDAAAARRPSFARPPRPS